MTYEYFYPGTPYSLDPGYGELFTGYRIPARSLGMPTDPRTANQLQEASAKLNAGVKVFEVSAIEPRIFEAIPEPHLKEINRLSKLAGSDISVHGPMIEPSGFSREGWSEANRIQAENQMFSAVERSHKLNPDGNIPVTFHSSAALPPGEETMKIKQINQEWKEIPKSVLVVDPSTGEIRTLKERERYFPGEEREFVPKREIERRNEEIWRKQLSDLNYYSLMGEDRIEGVTKLFGEKEISEVYTKIKEKPQLINQLPEEEREILKQVERGINHAEPFIRESYNTLRELYNRAYKESSPEDRKKLDNYANEIKSFVEKGAGKDPGELKKLSEVVEKGVKVLSELKKTPELLKPLNDFLIENSSKTFADVAMRSYEKFKDKSPIISIENPPAGMMALGRAEELKNLIEKSREEFVKKAVDKGISESKAKSAAEKIIGATWDVGHINMIRKYGYDKADVVKETEKIAPYVKHVHLSDNFGYEHTELPMGMGNVPIKEVFEKLEKEGKLGEIRKIAETGDWFQHFKTFPVTENLGAFGSPLYSETVKQPYWNQIAATSGSYFIGFGNMLPEHHFSMYGTGFSALPTELGGQIPGARSRMTGTPME